MKGASRGALQTRTGRRLVAVLAICWLAFGARVFSLDAQSLWYDEGLSVYLAGQPVTDTVSQSALTDHPPLHALMLGAWMRAAGRSEFAVRFLSSWWSVLAVALTWRLGRELLTDAIGAVAALLMAVSALAVWYAQEARGYSLLLALTLVTTWAFARLCHCHSEPRSGQESPSRIRQTLRFAHALSADLQRGRAGRSDKWVWMALVLSGIAALYTHYYAAFTLVALNLAFLAVLACRAVPSPYSVLRIPLRNTQYAIRFYLSQLAILTGFSPWLPAAIRQAATNATYFPGRVGWQTVVGDTLRAFATGDVTPATVAAWAVGAMGILAVLGALAEGPGTTRLNRVIAALLAATPVALMAVIAWQKPKFAPRYLIEALPAFYLLVGAGIAAVLRWAERRSLAMNRQATDAGPASAGRAHAPQDDLSPFAVAARRFIVGLLGAACVSVLLVTSALSLRATYFDPARRRPDMRSVAAYIAAHEQPGDVIVLLGGYQSPVFDYYYDGRNLVAPMPEGVMPPAQSPLDYRAAQQLQDIAHGHGRLWLVLWQRELADPTDVVLSELLARSRRLGVGRDFHDMRLLLFDLRDHAPFGAGPQRASDVRFAEPVVLAGHDLDGKPRAPGEPLDLALYWRSTGRIAANYAVFTHLLAPDGRQVAGSDRIAGADNYPTSLWGEGTLIRNTFTLAVPPDASPGTYSLEVGLYDARGRLRLADGSDRLLLAQIVVK